MSSVYRSYSPVSAIISSSLMIARSTSRISTNASLKQSRIFIVSSEKCICSRYPRVIPHTLSMFPSYSLTSHESIFINVLFPIPFGQTSATLSVAFITVDMFQSIVSPSLSSHCMLMFRWFMVLILGKM